MSDCKISWEGNKLIYCCECELKNCVETLLNDEKVRFSIQYQSKYNSYVCYDYEPFCTDTFFLKYIIEGDLNTLKFLEYYINKRIQNINSLEILMNKTQEKG